MSSNDRGKLTTEVAKSTKDTERTMGSVLDLCARVRETAYAIHLYHGHGHLEKVYENALAHRLRTQGLDVRQQEPIQVRDEDGTVLGNFSADLLVENVLVIELKTVKALAEEHVAQLLGYLKSTRLEHGLLINFGSPKFQIKKYILNDRSTVSPPELLPSCILGLFASFVFLCG